MLITPDMNGTNDEKATLGYPMQSVRGAVY